MPRIGSEEEYASQGQDRALMPEDDYIVEVKELTIKAQPNPYDNGKVRDTAMVKLDVISFSNGDPLFDVNDDPVSDRLFFDFLEIEKMGFSGSGKPSKARKFVAAALGQDVRQAIEFDDWQDLVGKRLIAHAIEKKNGKQGIDDYKLARQRRRGAAAEAPAPVALPGESIARTAQPEVDLTQAAADIFGEEATF